MKLHVHTFTWICGLVGCQPSSVAINFLDHVTKWAPHAGHGDLGHVVLVPPVTAHGTSTRSLASFEEPCRRVAFRGRVCCNG